MKKGYLPYLHNGKKFHTLPDGQCLYRYPKGDGVEIVKVSKELRRKLFELDKQEYNDAHREYRRRGELPTYDDTFSTVCQQYVRPDIVDIWMGDSPQRLVGKVYTHFPDEFMCEQMRKVQFPLP